MPQEGIPVYLSHLLDLLTPNAWFLAPLGDRTDQSLHLGSSQQRSSFLSHHCLGRTPLKMSWKMQIKLLTNHIQVFSVCRSTALKKLHWCKVGDVTVRMLTHSRSLTQHPRLVGCQRGL